MKLNTKEIPDKRKVFVGVEIGSKEINYGFVDLYGKLIHVESQTIGKEPGNEAEFLIWSMRGTRGDLNLRFKNFVGICICFTSKENIIENFAQQLNQNLNIPVYVEERDYLRQLGEDWLKKLGDKTDLEGWIKNKTIDLNVIYGGAKFVIEKTSASSKYISKGLLQDPIAPPSKKGQPYFIREEGEKVYTGFPLIKETETDGFIFGAISDVLEPDSDEGCTTGDGYVQAPDGSRAGIVWQIYPNGEKRFTTLAEPDEERWGVFNIGFPKPIKTLDDLIYNFKQVLPLIKNYYEDNTNILSKKIEPKLYFCLCCGYKTLEEKPSGTYEICHICGWEDDSGDGGANHVTLKEAKENFKKFGISDPEKISRKYIRKPTTYDIRHPDWESLYYPNE